MPRIVVTTKLHRKLRHDRKCDHGWWLLLMFYCSLSAHVYQFITTVLKHLVMHLLHWFLGKQVNGCINELYLFRAFQASLENSRVLYNGHWFSRSHGNQGCCHAKQCPPHWEPFRVKCLAWGIASSLVIGQPTLYNELWTDIDGQYCLLWVDIQRRDYTLN